MTSIENQIPDGDRTETDAAFQAGLAASKPRPLSDEGDGRFSVVTVPAGASAEIIDREKLEDHNRPAPLRKKGSYNVHTAVSFVDFVKKHGVAAEVWADEARQNLVGVLNANPAGATAWEDHRVLLELVHTPAWEAWTKVDGQLLAQDDFAELIEARTIDIVDPSAADMLEIAEHFHATSGLQYKSSKILASGQRQLIHVEETNATAGRDGTIEIPKSFTLAVAPFVGSTPRALVARFRYRISNGRLSLGFVLERPEDVLQDAFTELVTVVTTELPEDVPVYYGRPA